MRKLFLTYSQNNPTKNFKNRVIEYFMYIMFIMFLWFLWLKMVGKFNKWYTHLKDIDLTMCENFKPFG